MWNTVSEEWKSLLRAYIQATFAEDRDQLSASDFPSDQAVQLRFDDGSFAIFRYAFVIVDEKDEQCMVFTEHCGYHAFPIGSEGIEVVRKIRWEIPQRSSPRAGTDSVEHAPISEDESCPCRKCGLKMDVVTGPVGPFRRCSSYPICHFATPMSESERETDSVQSTLLHDLIEASTVNQAYTPKIVPIVELSEPIRVGVGPRDLVECPNCKVKVRFDRLERHIYRSHTSTGIAERKKLRGQMSIQKITKPSESKSRSSGNFAGSSSMPDWDLD